MPPTVFSERPYTSSKSTMRRLGRPWNVLECFARIGHLWKGLEALGTCWQTSKGVGRHWKSSKELGKPWSIWNTLDCLVNPWDLGSP